MLVKIMLMAKYKFNLAKFGTHAIIASMFKEGTRILDVGCNEGFLRDLSPSNQFVGIDYDSESLKKAAKKYQQVIKADLNTLTSIPKIEGKFDTIVFGDILEHLIDPEQTLKHLTKTYLKSGGLVIVSLPNVAHLSVRLQLLFGNFNYTESGVLDKTHLHLYTIKSATDLIMKSGLKIVDIRFSSNRFGQVIQKVPDLGPLLGYNLIFCCVLAQRRIKA